MAIYMEGNSTGQPAKMGHGVIRYSENPITCVIDSAHAGNDMAVVAGLPRPIPIVRDVAEARRAGAEVLLLGIAPSGGAIPADWWSDIRDAVDRGMSVLNGLHDRIAPRFPNLAPGQWIWDVRTEPEGLAPGQGRAASLGNRRLLMIGTDMSIGKMTAGLEIYRAALLKGVRSAFIATGQIGITLTGRGIPLDAIRLDFAGGAVEREVMSAADAELVVIEGQGSLVHPGSSATLPLLRGGCPTHLVLCHRAGQTTLQNRPEVRIPPLRELIKLYEDLAETCGTFGRPRTVAVCLNTAHIASDTDALAACRALSEELDMPCQDPVRHGASFALEALVGTGADEGF